MQIVISTCKLNKFILLKVLLSLKVNQFVTVELPFVLGLFFRLGLGDCFCSPWSGVAWEGTFLLPLLSVFPLKSFVEV